MDQYIFVRVFNREIRNTTTSNNTQLFVHCRFNGNDHTSTIGFNCFFLLTIPIIDNCSFGSNFKMFGLFSFALIAYNYYYCRDYQ